MRELQNNFEYRGRRPVVKCDAFTEENSLVNFRIRMIFV